MRVWDMGGSSAKDLDYSQRNGDGSQNGGEQNQETQSDLVGTTVLNLQLKTECFHREIDGTIGT